jgi:hypothetical protein
MATRLAVYGISLSTKGGPVCRFWLKRSSIVRAIERWVVQVSAKRNQPSIKLFAFRLALF